ncbi:Tetratricopeptide-like helical [Metarhizium rileyi]|uniref:Tetratricopeptide-like helical n=1 Tax=Metarhizium rileyi (strain RCEF 4871) TaxID=1649241 RepID=A0A162JQ22_METRR|nr:Tetratricopeptide-like helical [Metarhizium rileyi RCEF 4871]
MTDQSDRAAGRLGSESPSPLGTLPEDESASDPETPLASGCGGLTSLQKTESGAARSGGERRIDDDERWEQDEADEAGDNGDEDEDEDEDEDDEDDDDEDDDDDDDDDEPRLKYARLTQNLSGLYRNGDATSSFLVGGDKMIIGTHNGNINVIQLPTLQPLRIYHAHSASVTSISVSPYPPPLPHDKIDPLARPPQSQPKPSPRPDASPGASRRPKEPAQLPRIPSNDIYISTSSMDGNVCVQSLLDMKDVHLRNFARPVQAVALSPEFKLDRTYLSGGLAGQLIMTVGGGQGRSSSTTTGTAAAAASGWLGSMGLGTNTGKDTVLHSGEGTISSIKWSLSGKYVAWLNEFGIKFMRSKLHLESAEGDGAWHRIGHCDRPQTEEWDTMASVWKGRLEWIDEQAIGTDESQSLGYGAVNPVNVGSKRTVERLLVGWGSTIWIIHVHHDASSGGRNGRDRPFGRAEVAKILRMDCIISGISLYTQNTLLVLAFCPTDDDGDDKEVTQKHAVGDHKAKLSSGSTGSEPAGGMRRRQNNQPPELRLIDLDSQMEVDKDCLGVSRFERLGSADYHLGVLPAQAAATAVASRGALEALAGFGNDMWNAAINPKSLFSSGASIMSKDSGDDTASVSKTLSTTGTLRRGQGRSFVPITIHPSLSKPGIKIFIHSPYDCILGTKRDLADHLVWLVEHEQYQLAWELLDENPDIIATVPEKANDAAPTSPSKLQPPAIDEFFDAESVVESAQQDIHPHSVREKGRIGELWIQQLIGENNWRRAGEVCAKVLSTPGRWEKWVWTFAGAKHFDDITPHIPSQAMHPSLPSTIYEVLLGHYLQNDKPRFRELLDRWSTDLFDVGTITTALENQLKFRDVQEDGIEGGERGRDWLIVMESLSRLYEAGGRHREALKLYIKLHDADSAFRLIRDRHLAEAVADDIPSFIGLRVSRERMKQMTEQDLVEATSEAITLLVDEAQHGLVRPDVVVEQLESKKLYLYLYFYLKGLWRGQGIREHSAENIDRLVMDSQSLVDSYADLAVHLFAAYDRPLLMEFLKSSTSYTFEKAVQECETCSYHDELVYLYSKTGQMKRALYLIIDRLKNVQKAIEFTKEQDDPDLWNDLLDYSMDKPSFIRALLEQVGTAIHPITLVRRIPEGLEIQGLRDGLMHMMKEYELQHSISSGVAKVLRSELAAAQNELRLGQQKGIKFEVVQPGGDKPPKVSGKGQAGTDEDVGNESVHPTLQHNHTASQPGRCASCHGTFTEFEVETILGFVCGHVFHVSHLLELLHKGRKVDVELGREASENGRYSISMKVMRARLLRDHVREGCPICH